MPWKNKRMNAFLSAAIRAGLDGAWRGWRVCVCVGGGGGQLKANYEGRMVCSHFKVDQL